MKSSRLQKVALVTGASSGIGLATAKQLLLRGWSVQLHGLELDANPFVEDLLVQFPQRALYCSADFDGPELASQQLHEVVLRNFGRLDALISNAAITHYADFETVNEHQWMRVLRINLLSAFFLARDFRPELEASSGSVVLVSSTNAHRVNHNNMLYDVSKSGLNHLGRSLALELRERQVRVNVVMPGATLTPMLETWLGTVSGDELEAQKQLQAAMAKGLVATPDKVAVAIVSLLQDNSAWVTGVSIEVDGGAFLGEYWKN
ncbi:MAG: NAD(P)-dependent dehydrogenase (short-subunit alcohol dehydrogenase family) [Aquiluna sp.]|jgi:NAD(P)-dependent dehydrogenase (short-subunit alcohol dehydrogenase family)|tara:strand:- start:476 stop:1261 length:786 start_codon:yes stop_codon:yes gene_type:complete